MMQSKLTASRTSEQLVTWGSPVVLCREEPRCRDDASTSSVASAKPWTCGSPALLAVGADRRWREACKHGASCSEFTAATTSRTTSGQSRTFAGRTRSVAGNMSQCSMRAVESGCLRLCYGQSQWKHAMSPPGDDRFSGLKKCRRGPAKPLQYDFLEVESLWDPPSHRCIEREF